MHKTYKGAHASDQDISTNGISTSTIYIWCVYGVFGRKITKYMVMYGAYIRFRPTLTVFLFHIPQQHLVSCLLIK
jgi:hypothetical protein